MVKFRRCFPRIPAQFCTLFYRQNPTKPNCVFTDAALALVFARRPKTAHADFFNWVAGWGSRFERGLYGLVFLAQHCSLTLNQARLIPTSPYPFDAQTTVQGIEHHAVGGINGQHFLLLNRRYYRVAAHPLDFDQNRLALQV